MMSNLKAGPYPASYLNMLYSIKMYLNTLMELPVSETGEYFLLFLLATLGCCLF